jgi:hypothetical protein
MELVQNIWKSEGQLNPYLLSTGKETNERVDGVHEKHVAWQRGREAGKKADTSL